MTEIQETKLLIQRIIALEKEVQELKEQSSAADFINKLNFLFGDSEEAAAIRAKMEKCF